MNYEIFDTIIGADRELPFREPERATDGDVEIEVRASDDLAALAESDLGWSGDARFDVRSGGWVCSCRGAEGRIRYARKRVGASDLPLWHLLERLALPIQLALASEERLAVHGSSIVTDGRAWLFIGSTGSGKSTTAFELMRRHDVRLASDEMAVVDVEEGELLAGHPALRLEPGRGASAYAAESGAIHPAVAKRWYRFPTGRLARGRARLAGIVVLTVDADGGRVEEASGGEIGELRGGDRLTELLDQAFELEEVPDRWRERRFRNAAKLAKQVPVYELRHRRSKEGSPTHVEALWEFVREHESS